MRRELNIFVNLTALLAFIVVLITRIVLGLAGQGDGSQVFFGLSLQEWTKLQMIAAPAFTILVVIHIILHWRWFKNLPKTIRR